MCQSQRSGGQRCAAHTRPIYAAAEPGTDEWDKAAAEHASTRSGRKEIQEALLEAEENGDTNSAIALEHALGEGERLREASQEVRRQAAANRQATQDRADAATATASPASQEELVQQLAQMSEEMGFEPMVDRRRWANTGTLAFQGDSGIEQIDYTVDSRNGKFQLMVKSAPKGYGNIPAKDRSGRISYYDGNGLVFSSSFKEPRDVQQVLANVRTILTPAAQRKTNAPAPAPISQAQAQTQLNAMAEELGYATSMKYRAGNVGTMTFATPTGQEHDVRFNYDDRGVRFTLTDNRPTFNDIPAVDRNGRIGWRDRSTLTLSASWEHPNDMRNTFKELRKALT